MLRTRSLLAADRNRLEKEWAPKSSWNMSLEWPVSVVSLLRVSRSQTVMVLLELTRYFEVGSTPMVVTAVFDAFHLLSWK